jgi:4-amino-4-deoxy-L-arabinose transferase-like glycosyltransferase
MTTEPYTAQQEVITDKVKLISRIVVLAVALLLLSRNVTTTFSGWREDNSAMFSIFARNHLYYGLGQTKLFNTWDSSLRLPDNPRRYINRPSLLSLWVAIPMAVFGDHEWVARSVPIATTLGSVLILMVIVSRLQSPILGLLTGLFYVMLPVTVYFGRIVNYDSPVQFFSLLVLHGYLQWAGLYGNDYSRKRGAVYYVVGVVLGTGTGWTVAIMAGLVWLWHLCRVFRDRSLVRFLPSLTVIPAVSLAAVTIHILWGAQWKIGWLGSLFLSRTVGPEDPISWAEWSRLNWAYLVSNVSLFGIGAGIIYLGIIPAILRYTGTDSPLRQVVRNRTSAVPVLLIGLQGLIWVFVFKHQSAMHAFWQYIISAFVAVAMASVALAAFELLSKYIPRGARWLIVLLILLPVPSFARFIDLLYRLEPHYNNVENASVVFKKVAQLVPLRIPVMTSEEFTLVQGSDEIVPQVAYYANRPLIYTTDINEIETNSRNCAAYILRATNDPNTYQLAQQLDKKHKLVAAEGGYMIFLLNPPEKNAK